MAICTLSTSIHISLIILYAIVLAEASLDIVSEKTTFEVGDTIVINCTTVSHSAQSVQWFFNSNPIPEKQYTVISADLSQLVIPQSNFSNAGNYSCALLEALLEEIATVQIQVGEKPHPVSSFNCFSFNGIDILCTWDDGGPTNIPTTSTLMYKAYYAEPSYPGFDWTACQDSSTSVDCPDLHSYSHSCFIDGYDHHYGSTHNFTVIAENALGTSATWIHFNPEAEAVPFAPSNIKAVAESGQCVGVIWDYPCGWEHPQYFGSFFLQYRLRYKSEWDADEWEHPISQEYLKNKRVCKLEGYTHYSIQLSAGLTGQTKYWSDWSDIVVVRTLEQAPISHLEISYKNLNNKDESSKRDVTVFWKPLGVRQMKGEVLGYTITMSKEGENITISWNASANATSQVLQGLEKYASYDIQVVTFNSAGSSPPSLLTILDLALAPSEPLHVSAVALDKNTILVGWEPPEFPRGRIREYKIYWRSSSSELNLDGSTNKLQYEVEGLQEYVLYEFYIQAYRADGGGGLSQAVSQYTKEAVTLGAAEITNISATSRSISLRWQPPHTLHSRNNGNPIPMPDDYSILYNITYCIPSEPSSCIDVNIGSAEFVTLSDKIFPWTTYEITLQGNILHLGYGDLARVNVTTNEEDAPYVTIEDRSQHKVIEGNTYIANCTVDTNPPADVTWQYTNENIRVQDHQLFIDKAETNHYGNYTCAANNTFYNGDQGYGKSTMLLDVQYGPSIVITNGSLGVVVEGRKYEAYCGVDANPAAVVYWQHPSGDTTVNEALLLDSVTRGQRGEYRCFANNTFWDNSTASSEESHFLDVQFPPSVVLPTEVKCKVGERVELHCRVIDANPSDVDHTWYLVNGDILSNATAVISYVSRDLNGNQSCTANNTYHDGTYGTGSNVTFLDVQYLSSVNITIVPSKIKEGDDIDIYCKASDGNPEPYKIELIFKDETLATKDSQELHFEIIDISPGCSGSYQCRAFSNFYDGSENYSATEEDFVVYYSARLIPSNDTEFKLEIGEVVDINCTAHGMPVPSIKWFDANDREISDEDDNFEIRNRQPADNIITSILSVTLADSTYFGEYVCAATNADDVTGDRQSTTIIKLVTDNGTDPLIAIITVSVIVLVIFVVIIVAIIAYLKRRPKEQNGQRSDNLACGSPAEEPQNVEFQRLQPTGILYGDDHYPRSETTESRQGGLTASSDDAGETQYADLESTMDGLYMKLQQQSDGELGAGEKDYSDNTENGEYANVENTPGKL